MPLTHQPVAVAFGLGLSTRVGYKVSVRVGAFELEEEIGAGGMGVIWRARHVEQGVPAAVKFDLAARDPERREAFAAEVRRIAELDHPNVVHLFDTGVVTPDEAQHGLPDEVFEGTPWLAMELARAGSVQDWQPRDWAELLHVVTGLLRGLAKAHANGIVHRDIKAANLLLAGPRSSLVAEPSSLLNARVVLSDFGIGHDVDRPGSMDEKSVGTPRFMTPEQIEANWRDQGPWTDLYQTGVLLWRLATGGYPFDGSRPIQLYRAHLFARPPAFEPCMDVPEGLEAVCRQLLEKDIRARPQLAADVLATLEALGPPVIRSVPTLELDEPIDSEAPTLLEHTDGKTTAYLHRSTGVVLDQQLRGAGLGLWGLRPLPMVGREREQRVLSAALNHVVESRMPQAIVLQGPTGVGKSRLAIDCARGAHEQGLATYLVARHGSGEAGLKGMVRRHLRLEGLDREEAEARIDDRSGVEEQASARLLKTWLLGPTDDSEREPSIRERFAILANMLQTWGAARPRIVLLEDVEHGAESLRFVRWTLGQADFPVLFLLTAGEKGLAERPNEQALLESVLQEPGAQALPVDPLSEGEHRLLVRKMLGLEGRLAAEVERRTSGNPAFAVQLVNAWVESEQLVLRADGFGLKGEIKGLPENLLAIYTAQVRRLVRALAPDERGALHLLAMLGEEVAVREWQRACDVAGTPLRRGLVSMLIQRQVVRADGALELVRFRHAGFREALVARIREKGREPELAEHCIVALGEGADDERLALLLVAAGRHEQAVEPLQRAIQEQLEEDSRSPRLLELMEELLTEVAPKTDSRWGRLWLNYAWLYRAQGNHEKGDRLAARAELFARRHGWADVLGWALREAGSAAIARSDYDEAITYLEEAEAKLVEAGYPASAADCRTKIGVAYENQGRFDDAKAAYSSCLHAFDDQASAWTLAASPWIQLAQIAQKEGRLEQALDLAEEAKARAQRAAQTNHLGHIAALEGEIARALGDLELASERYNAAHELFDALRDPTATVAMLNLGVIGVLRGEYEETCARMEALLGRLERTPDTLPVFLAYARSVLLPCYAALEESALFGEQFLQLWEFLDSSGLGEPDILRLARIAAEAATDPDVIQLAERLVAQQEARLG